MLSCVDLAKTYSTERGEIEAVKGIDLEVRRRRVRQHRRTLGLRQVLVSGDDRRLEPAVARNGADRGYRYLEH